MLKLYVASKASVPYLPAMWREARDKYKWPIISSWIDEAGIGETSSWPDLWGRRIPKEINECNIFIAYILKNHLPVKGVLVEVGMALMARKLIYLVAPEEVTNKDLGRWEEAPTVHRLPSLEVLRAVIQNKMDNWR